jgi:hypothetical protein
MSASNGMLIHLPKQSTLSRFEAVLGSWERTAILSEDLTKDAEPQGRFGGLWKQVAAQAKHNPS